MNTHATTIVERLGNTAEVAKLFGLRLPSISEWKQRGIPRSRMMYIEVVRPDVLEGVDREAATSDAATEQGVQHEAA